MIKACPNAIRRCGHTRLRFTCPLLTNLCGRPNLPRQPNRLRSTVGHPDEVCLIMLELRTVKRSTVVLLPLWHSHQSTVDTTNAPASQFFELKYTPYNTVRVIKWCNYRGNVETGNGTFYFYEVFPTKSLGFPGNKFQILNFFWGKCFAESSSEWDGMILIMFPRIVMEGNENENHSKVTSLLILQQSLSTATLLWDRKCT